VFTTWQVRRRRRRHLAPRRPRPPPGPGTSADGESNRLESNLVGSSGIDPKPETLNLMGSSGVDPKPETLNLMGSNGIEPRHMAHQLTELRAQGGVQRVVEAEEKLAREMIKVQVCGGFGLRS